MNVWKHLRVATMGFAGICKELNPIISLSVTEAGMLPSCYFQLYCLVLDPLNVPVFSNCSYVQLNRKRLEAPGD